MLWFAGQGCVCQCLCTGQYRACMSESVAALSAPVAPQ